MFHMRYLFYFIVFPLIIAIPQINLHNTGQVRENEPNDVLQHDCLRVDVLIEEGNVSRQIMSYCMGELASKISMEKNDSFPKFTFDELSKQNITSQQLYLWSTPIDLIEDYQLYLNELSVLNQSSLSKEVFHNCTLPRFGSMCQYEINSYHPKHSSLYEIINDFYDTYSYKATNFTCYVHLQCNRGHSPICLDWTEICNGQIDCLDGGLDEEYCWQLEINECNDNEYRCANGQCIPKLFFHDGTHLLDCLDGSDEIQKDVQKADTCYEKKPSFKCEDRICKSSGFTSSCVSEREQLIIKNMFSMKDNSTSDLCWSAFKCVGIQLEVPHHSNCTASCTNKMCYETIEHECPDMLYVPTIPVLFADIYFAFEKYNSTMLDNRVFKLPYICYNNSRYNDYFTEDSNRIYNYSTVLFNNRMCHRLIVPFFLWQAECLSVAVLLLRELQKKLWRYQEIYNYNSTICNRSNMHQCANSLKCISIHRLRDGIPDCPNNDDETTIPINHTDSTEEIIGMNEDDDEESKMKLRYARKHISFQTICDGFTELLPIDTNGRNETDETECEQWACDNIYTHCDGLWNCLNGADEVGCDSLSPSTFNCSSNEYLCVSPVTNQFICLSINTANDGKIDCIGAADEPILCRTKYQMDSYNNFHCISQGSPSCITKYDLCDSQYHCDNGDDEQFCITNRTFIFQSICLSDNFSLVDDIENFLCNEMYDVYKKEQIVYFTLDGMKKSVKDLSIENEVRSSSSIIKIFDQHQLHCHRGIDLGIWLNNTTRKICFCPPSYYGDQCQYQNQRISLSIKFRALSDSWQIPFAIVVLLIDDNNEQIIHSYEQFTYLSMRDCEIKHNMYLVYSSRPKNETRNYGIHIDIYEKISLHYRGSFLFSIKFSFLPVHRLPLIIDIPSNDTNIETCSINQCINGKCIKYLNNTGNITFCRCSEGWSGRYCTIQHSSMCSSDSLYIDVSPNNRSICVCPINKFGPRCLLNNMICRNLTCQNGGQCIPTDKYKISDKKFICICRKGYIGDRCEINENQIILSFEKNIILSQSIFIHFIEVMNNSSPIISTTFQTILVYQKFITIFWPRPFHIVFIELFKKHYLAVVQNIYNRSSTITKMINPSDRCPHINEIFNETFVKLNLIRRIKYYHLPCQMSTLNLSCFYDDVHYCLCYNYKNQRFANCFEFNRNMTFDCLGQSVCQNEGKCFQDTLNCPKKSICVCSPCFYGRKCQFSTNGFGLSLDAILGYHILPNTSIKHQPTILIFSLTLTIIFIIIGLINGILSVLTFKSKILREVGCGVYLLGSSITTLLTTIMFGLKFWILIYAQITIISNRLFLKYQCITLDFLLRVCLNMDQWLNACVAIERAYTMTKGSSFNKKKSKRTAKFVIIILLVVIIGTSIHDPFYRRLIDEEHDENDEKRTWCVVTYPSGLQVYTSVMHTFHFLAPFILNLISAIILITKKSRQQSNIQTNRTYKEVLHEQLHEHKNLFVAPVVLAILAIPRLIISYVSKCMKLTNDTWLYLIGYFISFIPPMLTFVVFTLPSKFYKKEFHKSVVQYRKNIGKRLQFFQRSK